MPRERIFSVESDAEDDDDIWEKDAANGFLSYSKMEYVKNMRQVRQQSLKDQPNQSKEKKSKKAMGSKFRKFSVCGTATGWFCSCCCRKSNIQRELGVGVSIYFKQLKNLMMIFFLCTILSVPAFILFWSGRHLNNPDTSTDSGFRLNTFIASLSLANLGQKSINLDQLDLKENDSIVEMFCETGIIGKISAYGIAQKLETSTVDYFADTYCGLDITRTNREPFNNDCLGKQFCSIYWAIPGADAYTFKCRTEYLGPRVAESLDFSQYSLFLEYECDISEVDLYYFGKMTRTRLTNIVILCDALICVVFALNTCWLSRAISSEQHDVEKKFVQMTDFAVRVKGLPEKSAFDSFDQLRA